MYVDHGSVFSYVENQVSFTAVVTVSLNKDMKMNEYGTSEYLQSVSNF